MSSPSTIDAALALSCFLNVVTRRRDALTTQEKAEARHHVLRALAAINGRALEPGRVAQAVVIEAVVAVLDAAEAYGVTNAELAAAFNNTAHRRAH